MGTNYYWHHDAPCETCGRSDDPIHIGKSSGGWVFSLHVDPDLGIETLNDWRERFAKPDTYIEDEYGTRVSAEEMIRIITEREGVYSERDLRRHEIDHSCIGHGDGTWDYILGEFS